MLTPYHDGTKTAAVATSCLSSITMRLVCCLLLSLFSTAGIGASTGAKPVVTVAAIRLSTPSQPAAKVQIALETLGKAFTRAGYVFKVDRLSTDKIGAVAGSNAVDIFIASGGLYRSLVPAGARDISTLYDPRSASPNRGIGSNLIVRKDRSDIGHLKDLKGKSVIVTFPNAFTGNAYAMGEIARLGHDPETFFSKRIYRFPASSVIDSLLSGEGDCAVLVTCMLEEMKALGDPRADQVRVLDPRKDGELACEHTSMLYPSWTFATTPHATPEISAIATATLLSLPADENGWKWSVATDFSQTDELLKLLKTGSYSFLHQWTLKGIISRWGGYIALFLIALAMLLSHSFVLSVLVRRRTAMLADSIERERHLAEEKAAVNSRLEAMQRAGVVGQMGSMLAHELKQPLAAIRYLSRALMRLTEDPDGRRDRISEAASALHREAGRAAEIVDRVRSYAKKQSRKQDINLAETARLAVDNFAKSGRFKIPVSTAITETEILVIANPLEAELAIVNLLKNAAEACKDVSNPRITLESGIRDGLGFVQVSDNGPRLSDDEMRRLSEPLSSTKPDGLGLGLVIAASVAENAGGHLSFEQAPEKGSGLTATLTMALQEKTHGSDTGSPGTDR